MDELKNKKVLVIGLGISGQAAARFLLNRGALVCGIDRNHDLLNQHPQVNELVNLGMNVKYESDSIDLLQFDFIVVSPGVPPSNPFYLEALNAGIEVIGEIELACRFVQQPLLAITGTNGKTTTTCLVAHVLNQNGKPARALGNVGLPLTAELDSSLYGLDGHILVVELSSFQLETLHAKVVDAGVILNITPDHLDRYASMEEYAAAKIHLKECLKSQGKLYIYENIYHEFKDLFQEFTPLTYGYASNCTYYSDKEAIYFRNQLEFYLPHEYWGVESHDIENLMAAYILCKEMGITAEQFLNAFKTFKKPAHRLEFVRSFKEVAYYDDSKGTNIDAVIRAVNSLKGEIILIAGGVDKGAAYSPWINAFAGKVKCIFAIGQAAMKIKQDMAQIVPVEERASLEEAVKDATTLAKPGQVVLLSPGCSSFDMFRDYVHRGEEFKRIVYTLN